MRELTKNQICEHVCRGKHKCIVAAVLTILIIPICLYGQTDSIWIESGMAEPGGEYHVSLYCRLYQPVSGIEIPLAASSRNFVFDTATSEGSILPADMEIFGLVKENGKRILINVVTYAGLDSILPPGGKLGEIHFHIRPDAQDQVVFIDTLSDTLYSPVDSSVLQLTPLQGWQPNGYTIIPLAFGKGRVEIYNGIICGNVNNDGVVDIGDVIWLLNFIFLKGNPPDPYYCGDVNLDDMVNFTDAIYIVNYIYRAGPAPCENGL